MRLSFADKKNQYRTISLHIIGCAAFLFLPILASPATSFIDRFKIGIPEIKGIISSFLLIIFFYLNYFLFIPEFLHKKKYIGWLFIVIISFITVIFIPNAFFKDDFESKKNIEMDHPDFNHQNMPEKVRPNDFPPDFKNNIFKKNPILPKKKPETSLGHFFRKYQIQESLLKFLFLLAFSVLLKTNKLWKESREEKRKAELIVLKSQLNPHFLFNTLNGIYALSLENSSETSKAIVKLSELMRYMVSEIKKENVLLRDEIKYLQNYIDLQRLRLGETVKITFDTAGVNPKLKISPLLFIVFVENAFKYGINTSKISEIFIQIKNTQNDLYFCVKNQKGNEKNDSATQIGLENVIRRLELIYPQQHTLRINETDEEYFVELIIKTNND